MRLRMMAYGDEDENEDKERSSEASERVSVSTFAWHLHAR